MATSGIGNYIHFNFNNYRSSGIAIGHSTDSSSSSINPTAILNKYGQSFAANRFIAGSMETAAQIEKNLNYFYGNNTQTISGGEEGLTSEQREAIQQAVEQIITSKVNLNLNNLSVTANNTIDLGKVFGALSTSGINSVQAIANRINALNNALSQIDPTDTSMIERINNLRTEWDNIKSQSNIVMSSTNGAANLSQIKTSQYNIGNKNFIVELNDVISDLQATSVNYWAGLAAEAVVALTNAVLEKRVKAEAADLVKAFIGEDGKSSFRVGTNQSMKTLNSSNFSNLVAMSAEESISTNLTDIINRGKAAGQKLASFDNGQIQLSASMDKVDAVINGEPVSIKNVQPYKDYLEYHLSNYINLYSSSSATVLALVQDEPNFVNHYLNVMSSNVSHNSAPGIDGMRSAASAAMSTLLFQKALSGGVTNLGGKSENAKYLVVNVRNDQGKWKVYSMESLIAQVNNLLISGQSKEAGLRIDGFNPSGLIANEFFTPPIQYSSKGANARITKIVAALATAKLSISISKNSSILQGALT